METLRYHCACIGQFWRERLRKTTLIMAVVLVVSGLLGYFMCAANPDVTNAVVEYFLSAMLDSGVISETGTLSLIDLLLNNWMAILMCVVYGFIPFLFLPVLILFSNAYLVGVMGAYYHINGIPMLVFFAGILPHGIFELPALVIAAAMGFILCLTLVKKLLHTPNTPPMKELASDTLRTLLLVVFPLLLCAAVVEAYITPLVITTVAG